ncbi:MAG: fibronectin type III domain-containing protein [Flavobacteriia bacterium]|nr:fibronectin type III domain-containing protein [Flavobacteriia bacterium]
MILLNRVFVIIVFFVTACCNYYLAQSTANYTFTTNSTSSLNDLSSGSTQLIAASNDDVASSVTNIGFDFWMMGVHYTQFSVNSNGLLRLGSTTVTTTTNTTIGGTASVPYISAFSFDTKTGSTGKVHYKLTGSAPNRVLTVEWKNMLVGWNATTDDGVYQIILNETSGVIQFVYGTMVYRYAPSTTTVTAGIQSSSSSNTYATINVNTNAVSTTSLTNYNLGSTVPTTLQVNSSSNGSRRTYLLTPPIPASPSSLTVTSITSSSMLLGWTDNSSNENGFVIYRSDDGGTTYSFINQVAANSTSSSQTGLVPSTTYFWKVYAVTEGGLSNALSGSGTTLSPGTCTSTATGNWGTSATWSCGTVPTAGDNVVIANGHTVTIDVTSSVCYSLTVGQGTSGILKFDGTARTLTVGSNVTVASGGTFQANSTGSQTGHLVAVGGNYTNNGTTDFYVTSTRAATLKFTGSSNATFSGTGATTDLYLMTIDKGTSSSSILELTTSNFTIKGSTSSTTGFLTLTNGMLKVSGSFTGSHYVFTAANYSIGSTAGFWLNNSNFTVTAQAGMLSLYGNLKISAGTYNIGTTTDHDLGFYGGGNFEITGGTINVAESVFPYTSSTYYYTQSGGTVNVCTGAANPYSGAGSLHLDSYCNFNMSGGTIVIRNPSTVATASSAYDYYNFSGTRTITGGTVQFGDASTVGTKSYKISGGYFPGLTINNTSGNHTVILSTLSSTAPTIEFATILANNTTLDAGNTYSCDALFNGNITIGTGAVLNQKNAIHTIKGNFANDGTFTTTTGTLIFLGSSNQSISGGSTSSFYNLTNSNTSTGITLSSDIVVTNILAMSGATADIFLNGKNISLSSTGTLTGESNTDRIYGITGSITTTRNINAPSALNVAGLGLTLTSIANLGSTTITRTHREYSNSAFTSILRNYQISPTTNSGLDATINVDYFDNELNGQGGSEADFVLWRSTDAGTTWTNRNGTENQPSNSISLGSIDAFSLWTVAPPISAPLPITLLTFEAFSKNDDVAILWKTATEYNNDKFIVERSLDGKHFEQVGVESGAGFSIHTKSYSMIDKNYHKGVNYYRLNQVDFDGKNTYSQIVSVDMTNVTKTIVMIINSLGQRVDAHYSGVVFDVFSDGTMVKRVQ